MALRVFADRDGQEWNVWRVQPTTGSQSLHERFREGWICFEQVSGIGRCRLPLDEVPPGWEELPDDRLDLLRRVAQVSSYSREAPVRSVDDARTAEEESRGRVSGPKEMAGHDETE
jgi:hypothetical protein